MHSLLLEWSPRRRRSAYAQQRTFAYEAGLFASYTKFADTTHIKAGGGSCTGSCSAAAARSGARPCM